MYIYRVFTLLLKERERERERREKKDLKRARVMPVCVHSSHGIIENPVSRDLRRIFQEVRSQEEGGKKRRGWGERDNNWLFEIDINYYCFQISATKSFELLHKLRIACSLKCSLLFPHSGLSFFFFSSSDRAGFYCFDIASCFHLLLLRSFGASNG